jgi:hypothetical protein
VIVPAKFRPEADMNVPAKGWLAGAGRKSARWAGKGALGPLSAGGGGKDSSGLGTLFLLALSVTAGTIGGVAGGVAGAIQAESSEQVDNAEKVITTVIDSLKMQETMCERVSQVANKQTRDHIAVIPDQGPAYPEERKSYGSLAVKGIDTILEISIPRFALAGDWDINPPLQFHINSNIRLVQATDGKEFYGYSTEYFGSTRTFYEWADNDAQLFLKELDQAYQSLAEKIVGEVFLFSPLAESEESNDVKVPER